MDQLPVQLTRWGRPGAGIQDGSQPTGEYAGPGGHPALAGGQVRLEGRASAWSPGDRGAGAAEGAQKCVGVLQRCPAVNVGGVARRV